MPKTPQPSKEKQLTMQVVDYVRALIQKGALRPGDRIPPEREFARELNISRASLRTGIGYLAALGVIKVRHGVGAFVADGSAEHGVASVALLGALQGFETWQMFEARRVLEGTLAALAAERGDEEQFAALAEEVAEMQATVDDPAAYLIHDVRFHRTIAEAAGNPVLRVVMETITAAFYDHRRKSVEQSASLQSSVAVHTAIYHAIRARNGARAQTLMERHLRLAESAQGEESRALKPKARVATARRSVHGKKAAAKVAHRRRKK